MSQDIITYKQKIVAVPDENVMAKVYADENYHLIIKVLRKGPMTVNDLVEEFEKHDMKKSDKSIYRYLKDLIDLKLVARAGKRIKSLDEKELQSETIYIRTAKIFLAMGLKHKEEKMGKEKVEKLFEAIFELLHGKYSDRVSSSEGIKKLLTRFDGIKEKLLVEMLENADKEILKKISDVDWDLVSQMIEYSGWLALILELDVEKEIKECCPE